MFVIAILIVCTAFSTYLPIFPRSQEITTFLNGSHTIHLNTSRKSALDLESHDCQIRISFIFNDELITTTNFTYDRFLVNVVDANGTHLYLNNITVNSTFTLEVLDPNCVVSFYLSEIITLDRDDDSRAVQSTRYQIFHYPYTRGRNAFGIAHDQLRLTFYSLTFSQYIVLMIYSNGVTPFAPSETNPNGREFGSLQFLIEPGNRAVITQNIGGMEKMDFFFEIVVQNSDIEDISYVLGVTQVFNLNLWTAMFVIGASIVIIFVCVMISCFCCRVFRRVFCDRTNDNLQDPNNVENLHQRFIREFFGGAFIPFSVENNTDQGVMVELPKPDADAYKKRRKILKENELCCVCLDYKKVVKFGPCEHICTCEWCAEAIVKSSGICPLCRAKIDDHEVVEDLKIDYDNLSDLDEENESNASNASQKNENAATPVEQTNEGGLEVEDVESEVEPEKNEENEKSENTESKEEEKMIEVETPSMGVGDDSLNTEKEKQN